MIAGQRAVDLSTERYNRGLTDFFNVVDAERQFYDLQDQYAAAQVSQGEQFVQHYKSLGGGWQIIRRCRRSGGYYRLSLRRFAAC